MDWVEIKKTDYPDSGEVVLVWAKNTESGCTGFRLACIDENIWKEYPSLDEIDVYAWKQIRGPYGQKEKAYL